MNTPSETRKTSSSQSPASLQDCCWLIPVVMASVTFLISIMSSSNGYLYVLYMDRYSVDRETASWVESTYLVAENLIAFGLVFLQAKISVFWLTMFSATAVCAGAVGGAFCPDMVWMAVAVGGVYGAGHGATLTCFAMYTMLYFDRYKATATGVKSSALAASGLAAPAIMSLLVGRYGLQGALLLGGAIAMHAVPLLMLIKQPRPFKLCCRHISTVQHPSGSGEKKHPRPSNVVENPQLQQTSLPLPLSSACQHPPALDMVGISAKSAAEMLVVPEFYVLLIVYFVNVWTAAIHATTVVDYGRDKGAPLESANYIQTYGAIGDLLARTVVPFFSDKVPFGHCLFVAAGLVGSSLTLFGMTFNQSFACFATLNALLGACQGYVSCMRCVLITNYLGLERLPLVYGCLGLILTPISLGSPTIIGFFRDTLGSYDNFYRVFGAVNILVSVPLFFITCRDRARKRAWEVNHDSGLPAG